MEEGQREGVKKEQKGGMCREKLFLLKLCIEVFQHLSKSKI